MRPRIPLAYAGLLIIALVAVVGFAAFSPSAPTDDTAADAVTETIVIATPASARVASAVLALRVSDADSRTATTETTVAVSPSTSAASASSDESTSSTASTEEDTGTTEEPPTTQTAAPADDEPAPAPAATADTTPPAIKVTSPKDGATVDDRIVTFEGTTEPGASVSSGPYDAAVSDNGSWSMSLVLSEGANGASFTATDSAGNSNSTRIVVHRTVAATTTTKAPSKPQTTTTTKPATTVTTPSSKWSPSWPADSGGIRNVEAWRSTVEKYWPAARVDCVLGIIKRESRGDPRAYNSGSNAEGLMQHLGKYWVSRAKGAGFVDGNGLVATPFNGAANIAAGAYLANYYDNVMDQWWNPWKSGSGFTAQYGSCQSSNPS